VGTKDQKRSETLSQYIFKVPKQAYPDIGNSNRVIDVMNSVLFDRITTEVTRQVHMNFLSTLSFTKIRTAARLVLPGGLASQTVSERAKAVAKFKAE
jgi:hypothetical protein